MLFRSPDAVGSSDVQVSIVEQPYLKHLVEVQAHQRTRISSWQIEKVTLALDNSFGEESVVVNWSWGSGWGTHAYQKQLLDKTKVMTVTVYYKNGETQTVKFDPNDRGHIVIKRNP